jgi:lipopolysaccharide/colanic/teichoic acid biosynthesis glycosyltransferase
MIKRLFDLGVAVILFIVLFPLMILTGMLVRCTSSGPIILKQVRVGYQGKKFRIFKFRTMFDGTEKLEVLILKGDPQITKVGKFLRATHTDELPQLWNVIKNDMSLVGPRPMACWFFERCVKENPDFWKRLDVLPGLTGIVQLCNNDKAWLLSNREEALAKDIDYIKNRTFLGDLFIVFKTIFIVLKRQGN